MAINNELSMSPDIEYESTPEGLIATIRGPVAPFSFLIGKGRVGRIPHEHVHLWSVEDGNRNYVLQFILHALPQETVRQFSAQQLLILHMEWETDFQHKHGGRTVVDGSQELDVFPTGEDYLLWLTEGPRPDAVPGDMDELTNVRHATTDHAHGSTLASDHVIFLTVQGMGDGWSRRDLRDKCLRTMLSIFRGG
jgi:hypothetical protein